MGILAIQRGCSLHPVPPRSGPVGRGRLAGGRVAGFSVKRGQGREASGIPDVPLVSVEASEPNRCLFARDRGPGDTGHGRRNAPSARAGHTGLVLLREGVIMMEFRSGDILAADVEALVNTVNCVGIMGRGIALQFKNAFPANFRAYEAACYRGEVQPGGMFVFATQQLTNPR